MNEITLKLNKKEYDMINLALNEYRENLQYNEIESFDELEEMESEVTDLINKLEKA